MVLEFCDGGTFEDYDVGGVAGFAQACILFRGIVLALEYLHSWGIAHRDIKVRALTSQPRVIFRSALGSSSPIHVACGVWRVAWEEGGGGGVAFGSLTGPWKLCS